MLTLVIPCIDDRYLSAKLDNVRETLAALAPQTIVCFNGPDAAAPAVEKRIRQAVAQGLDAELVRTLPGSKNRAMLAGLARARHPCIFSTDVDCYIVCNAAAERWRELIGRAVAGDVIAFPVLTALPHGGAQRAPLQDALATTFRRLGLRFHRVRGGGWMSGNYQALIDLAVMSDDLHYPLTWLAGSGGCEIMARDIVIVEDPASLGDYAAKVPRLMFGAWQAMRLAVSWRNRLSILSQKIALYAVVALAPPLAAAALTIAIIVGCGPPWAVVTAMLAVLAGLAWKRRLWVGCLRGWATIAIGRPPRW